MTHRVVISPAARDQLGDLFDYLADAASPALAARYTDDLIEHLDLLAAHPRIGIARDDIRPGLRTLVFRGRVTIAFAVDTDNVVILGLYTAGRNVEALLRND